MVSGIPALESIDNKLKCIFARLKGNRLLHQASINGKNNKKIKF